MAVLSLWQSLGVIAKRVGLGERWGEFRGRLIEVGDARHFYTSIKDLEGFAVDGVDVIPQVPAKLVDLFTPRLYPETV